MFPQFTHGAGKRPPLNDGDITRAVEWQLAFDEAVPSHLIDVYTRNGVVSLQGWVDNLLAKERASQRAEATRGVKSVINLIAVRPVQRADEAIKRDIEWALIRDPATDRYKIAVEVDRKIATLMGTLESWQEKEVAAEVAKGVKGLTGLNNEITVNYQAQRPDAQIDADVKRRLASDVLVDARRIMVDVDDGNVYLTGEVGSAAEKSRAIRDGWVAGVKSVGARGLEIQPELCNPFQKPQYVHTTDKEIERSIREALRYDARRARKIYSFGATGSPESFLTSELISPPRYMMKAMR
jgi:osmotically-inducible protein OsmY